MPQVGDKISLATQLYDNAENKFPLAVVRDDAGVEIDGSPFALDSVADGLYADYEQEFPSGTDYLQVAIFVYSDSGHTTLDEEYSTIMYNIEKTEAGSSGSSTPNTYMVGILDGETCEGSQIQDQIVQGEDHRLNVRLVRGDNGEPYDLSDADSVIARFLNEDETVLEVEGTIVSAEAGKVYFLLAADKTVLLMPGTPAPFTVVVDLGSDTALGNLPYQLAVVAPSVPAA